MEVVQDPCEKRVDDPKQFATEWISTEMHSNHSRMSAEPKRPLSLSLIFSSAVDVSNSLSQYCK